MKTKILICALAVATLAVGSAACGKKSSSGAPAFFEPTGSEAQIDRMGRPAINTIIKVVLDSSGNSSSAFNGANPSGDTAFVGALGQIVSLIHACPAPAVANALLPDVLTFNVNTAANYAMLNGRALTDDVFDDTLHAVYTNSNGQFGCGSGATAAFLSSGDHITMNDVPLGGLPFPFLAAPH